MTGESRISNLEVWLDTQSIIDILDDAFWSKAVISINTTKLTLGVIGLVKRTSTPRELATDYSGFLGALPNYTFAKSGICRQRAYFNK